MFTMRFLGDSSFEKAPQLRKVEVDDMSELARQTLGIMEKMVQASIVHGDLSEYNLVLHGDRLFAIDFLQSIDFSSRVDRHRLIELAKPMLARDLGNISRFFAKHKVRVDPDEEYARLLPMFE
jgi:RIO kinase 1